MSDRYRGATLAEFEAWCKGEGRGPMAGWHRPALDALDRFVAMLELKDTKAEVSEKLRYVED